MFLSNLSLGHPVIRSLLVYFGHPLWSFFLTLGTFQGSCGVGFFLYDVGTSFSSSWTFCIKMIKYKVKISKGMIKFAKNYSCIFVMRFLAEPTIALYLMSNVKGLLPNKIKQRLQIKKVQKTKSIYFRILLLEGTSPPTKMYMKA